MLYNMCILYGNKTTTEKFPQMNMLTRSTEMWVDVHKVDKKFTITWSFPSTSCVFLELNVMKLNYTLSPFLLDFLFRTSISLPHPPHNGPFYQIISHLSKWNPRLWFAFSLFLLNNSIEALQTLLFYPV